MKNINGHPFLVAQSILRGRGWYMKWRGGRGIGYFRIQMERAAHQKMHGSFIGTVQSLVRLSRSRRFCFSRGRGEPSLHPLAYALTIPTRPIHHALSLPLLNHSPKDPRGGGRKLLLMDPRRIRRIHSPRSSLHRLTAAASISAPARKQPLRGVSPTRSTTKRRDASAAPPRQRFSALESQKRETM